MPAYSVLPSLMQWQQDSSAFLAERREDIILMRIDNIVDALQRTKAEGEPLYLQAELYFATNYWLKTLALGKNPKLKKGREDCHPQLMPVCDHPTGSSLQGLYSSASE